MKSHCTDGVYHVQAEACRGLDEDPSHALLRRSGHSSIEVFGRGYFGIRHPICPVLVDQIDIVGAFHSPRRVDGRLTDYQDLFLVFRFKSAAGRAS